MRYHDLLIRHEMVACGTDKPKRLADVAIDDGGISEVDCEATCAMPGKLVRGGSEVRAAERRIPCG